MNNIENHLSVLKVKERQLETLSEMIDKEGLTQCIRLLSTYIAMYKKDFGELTLESYEAILESTSVDPDMVNVFENGMSEAVAMLSMIVNMQKMQDDGRLAVTIN
jgi:succinate dehydrogenase flavin-adding protein (antitoxin of CptAB toxin-antitoxin module)